MFSSCALCFNGFLVFGRSAICFVFILLVVFFYPLRQVFSLGSLGCHGTCSVDQAGLQLRDPPARLSNAGIKVPPPEFFFFFFGQDFTLS